MSDDEIFYKMNDRPVVENLQKYIDEIELIQGGREVLIDILKCMRKGAKKNGHGNGITAAAYLLAVLQDLPQREMLERRVDNVRDLTVSVWALIDVLRSHQFIRKSNVG